MATIRQAPNQIAKGRVDLDADRFDVTVYQKGLDVIWESSVICPCKGEGRGFLTTCNNCGGTGYVFINPIKTKMLVQSMNLQTKYTEWSMERIGTVSITCRSVDVVGDMDRITLVGSVSKFSQVVHPEIYANTLFSFVAYPIQSIIDVFQFVKSDSKLKLLPPESYKAQGNKILFDKKLYNDELTLTVRYTHEVQYHIVDIPREIRQSIKLVAKKETPSMLPISAIGRRAHYVIKPEDYQTNTFINNSYK